MTDGSKQERTLVLLRHAKAEQLREDGPDAERPLTARGHADAAAAGAWLARHTLVPDVVLCSPARRTRQTWHGLAMGITGSPPEGGPTGSSPVVRYEPTAYEARPEDLLELVRAVPPGTGTVLLVAHNPGISLLSALLDPQRADPDGLRTTDLVVHRPTTRWAALAPGGAPITGRHTARG
ncbi:MULTISPECIES: histidine phosphatase family protein [Micromonospora]|uniref:Histidine phosphatase family protein n=1 Tax=Micromonospora solifontis TaxID=2487138 RepID=A0ABX9WBA8_9ACTN|nr:MULTISPECIES: histidine phosphatase family protein [Micromonospora]NES14501.1 histidine phosphatase family protein [Micromonospora sp. PPF5-17B]NES38653.1 histidine phosphatase family protein [Micromonospora solifontis]NES56432.1 histidine phosphatase family protein [Micromonospora sp. PPF5-6]RNL94040.1 histidine phosphatase family protein [Micromonospora solifontis]